MTAPLSHIRVLDLSRILAGPWAAQHLADMGAEVIKIERPVVGDDTRGWGPPFAVEADETRPGISAYFACANRGKKSCAVDLTKPEGQAIVRRLAETSDVVIENFKVGGLAQYGLDYEGLRSVNPGIVYCSITGFGQNGPYASRAGYDFLLQGMGGLMSVTGEPDDNGGAPVKVGVAITDQLTGMNALAGILSCLIKRSQTGEGDHIDVSLLDCTIAGLVNQASTYHIAAPCPDGWATPIRRSCPIRCSKPPTVMSFWRSATMVSSSGSAPSRVSIISQPTRASPPIPSASSIARP